MTPDQFLQFAEPLPEPTFLVSGDGLILAGNRATEDRLGVAPHELRGRRLAEVVADPPEEVARYLRSCSRSRKMVLGSLALSRSGGEPVACRSEGAVVRPKGEGVEALLLLRLIPKDSAIGQFVALNQRIDDLGKEIQRRKLAEEDLWHQKERLRVTLASIGDAVIVTDERGRVTFQNAVAEGLTGWKVEALGRELTEVFDIINETSRQPVESPATRALREGVIVGLANHTLLIAKDGSERPIDDSAAPIRDAGGHVAGCVLVFRDISERKVVEERLREAEEQFRTLADNIPQLAWMTRPDGHIFWYNRRWYDYTGTTLEQMQGWGWQSVHDPAELPRVLAKFKAHVASGEPWEDTFPLRRHDGEYRWHLSRAVPVRDDQGRVVRWFGTNTDISERREADRRKDEFLAVLAHELRNPLAPIRNGLQVMKLAGGNGEYAERSRSMMERQLNQMVRLVDDLLDVSRITRNKLELRKGRVELAAAVGSAVETSRPVVDEAGHELTVSLPPEPVYVDADLTRLAQVFANLLNNAAKYTPRGGRITLAAERDGAEAVVSVRDTGVGIPANMLPRVFEMFTQVDRSLEKAQGGLGIGLTIVKRLVEMHGGTVEARSDGEGRGSEFAVRLPVVAVPVAKPPEGADGAAAPTAKRKVLVVDDNRDSATSLAMLLTLMGNEVRTAHDGLEAIEAAAQYRPDLILMDVGMPKMNGFDATRRIREQDWGKGVKIVALTGWGQPEDKRQSQEAGCDGHMVKPVDPAALEKLLAGLSEAARV